MRAIVRDKYGGPEVLHLEDIERPVPRGSEVCLRVRASSLNRADRYVMQGTPMPIRLMTGLFGPRKRGMGMDFSGVVESLGPEAVGIEVGDEVFGQMDNGETWAEYACVSAEFVAPKPGRLSHAQSAAIPLAGLTALQGLRDAARVQAGQRVLINGSTGAVGTFAVQIAKALGANVTAVCSERNVELVRSLGADELIAYEQEDFTQYGRKFDVLFDVVGNRPLASCRRVLEPKGCYLPVGAPEGGRWLGPIVPLLTVMLRAPFVSQRVATFTGTPRRADLVALAALVESGDVTPAICRQFELGDCVEAMRFLAEGRPPSKVVLTLD
jgi:NADPH:quinone reductase-like Zn-dependent oxidoreductase